MHYDFIEIGTSDFDTEIERARLYDRGISIDPILYYLNKLPNKQFVHKVLAAVSDNDDTVKSYYIPEETIQKYNWPWWLRGCNSIKEYHETGLEYILKQKLNPEDIFVENIVNQYSVKTLFEMYQVSSINFLKIDTEGHDNIIINNYLDWAIKNNVFAKEVMFEISLATTQETDDTIQRFVSHGYTCIDRSYQDVFLWLT